MSVDLIYGMMSVSRTGFSPEWEDGVWQGFSGLPWGTGHAAAGRAETLPDAKSLACLERGRLLWIAPAGGRVLLFGFPLVDRCAVVSDLLRFEFPP